MVSAATTAARNPSSKPATNPTNRTETTNHTVTVADKTIATTIVAGTITIGKGVTRAMVINRNKEEEEEGMETITTEATLITNGVTVTKGSGAIAIMVDSRMGGTHTNRHRGRRLLVTEGAVSSRGGAISHKGTITVRIKEATTVDTQGTKAGTTTTTNNSNNNKAPTNNRAIPTLTTATTITEDQDRTSGTTT